MSCAESQLPFSHADPKAVATVPKAPTSQNGAGLASAGAKPARKHDVKESSIQPSLKASQKLSGPSTTTGATGPLRPNDISKDPAKSLRPVAKTDVQEPKDPARSAVATTGARDTTVPPSGGASNGLKTTARSHESTQRAHMQSSGVIGAGPSTAPPGLGATDRKPVHVRSETGKKDTISTARATRAPEGSAIKTRTADSATAPAPAPLGVSDRLKTTARGRDAVAPQGIEVSSLKQFRDGFDEKNPPTFRPADTWAQACASGPWLARHGLAANDLAPVCFMQL